MLCVRCKKRPAIVFVQKMEAGEAKSEGYCLSCARELGIKPVDDIMKQFGISDQDLEAMEERFAGMMENGDMDPAAMMQQLGMMAPQDDADGDEAPDDDTDEGGDGDFTPGGNATFPFGIFGGRRKAEEAPEKEERVRTTAARNASFWTITARTSPARRGTESWTASWAATGKFTAPSRSFPAARRTIPASSVRRAWARRPSPRA